MKSFTLGLALLGGLLGAHAGWAQAPAGAPSGATGICKDGTYSTAPSKSGACAGHKGVQTWYAPAATAAVAGKPPTAAPASPMSAPPQTKPAAAAGPAPASSSAPAGAKAGPAAAAAAKAQAPGGGPNLVWVNTASNVYHCPGTTYYGKTKEGSYMTEADAKAKGAHGVRGAACSK